MNNTKVYTFKNSEACHGIGIEDTQYSHDIITIDGFYPDEGSWACNELAEEKVIIVSGSGGVELRGGNRIELDSGQDDKRAVTILAGDYFRWYGSMTLSMVCHPKFDADKYHVVTEVQLQKETL